MLQQPPDLVALAGAAVRADRVNAAIRTIATRPPDWARRSIEGRQRLRARARFRSPRGKRVAMGPPIDVMELAADMDLGLATLRAKYDDRFWRIADAVGDSSRRALTDVLKILPAFNSSIRIPRGGRALRRAVDGYITSFKPRTHVTVVVNHSCVGTEGSTAFELERLEYAWARIANNVTSAGHRIYLHPEVRVPLYAHTVPTQIRIQHRLGLCAHTVPTQIHI